MKCSNCGLVVDSRLCTWPVKIEIYGVKLAYCTTECFVESLSKGANN